MVPTRALTTTTAALLSACVTPPPDAAWGPGFDGGPHVVGFRSETLTRTADDGSVRSLTVSVWYPARRAGPPLRLGEILGIVLEEGQLSEAQGLRLEPALAAATTGDSTAIPLATARVALERPTLASRDAPPANGPFPLALWGSRHATVLAQAPLSELLASHGIVVATVWSSDPPLAFVWEDKPVAERLATMAAQTEDLRHVLGVLRADPKVDDRRSVLLAWSYGGQSAARIQQVEDGMRAVVSLDANVLPARPEESLRLRRPLVWLIGRDTGRRGYEGVDTVGAPVLIARLPELEHGDFNAMESHLPARLGADTLFPWSGGGEVGIQGYEALARMVLVAVRMFHADSTPDLDLLAEQLRVAAAPVPVEVALRRGGSARRIHDSDSATGGMRAGINRVQSAAEPLSLCALHQLICNL